MPASKAFLPTLQNVGHFFYPVSSFLFLFWRCFYAIWC